MQLGRSQMEIYYPQVSVHGFAGYQVVSLLLTLGIASRSYAAVCAIYYVGPPS
jgi:hypothetical protein